MNLITKKTVFVLCLICSMSLSTFAQLTGPVSISVSISASPKEIVAAREVRRFLYLRTATLIDIKSQDWNDIPVDENVIIIGSLISTTVQQFLTANSIASPSLGVEDFYLKTITDGTRKVTLIAGYDETAALRGAYKLMEKFGVRYSHVEDIVAEGTIVLDFPAIDKVYSPNFAVRGSMPYHSWNPEGPEYWSADFYKSFLTQQFKMGQNIMGIVHDYTVSDTRAWVWSPSTQDNKENKQYEVGVNAPSAGAAQVFSSAIFASPRRLEARKISDLTQRDAYMKQANLDFLKDVYGYARTMGVKTIYGSEHSGDVNYYLKYFNDLKTFNPDYCWIMTKEYWVWNSGKVTDQDYIWIIEGIQNALKAKVQTNAAFDIGVTGWRLGPPLSAGGQTAISKAIPEDIFISCQTPNVGQDPVQPEWAQITKTNKWIIPWLEDDFSVGNQQLWVNRTINQATAGKSYGCNGLLGVHWSTKRITPQLMVTAQLGWDATITKKSFWDDFCLINFGSEVASAASTIFQNQDGNMARVTNWINNWPGTIASGSYNFSYVDQFAALRPSVVGASNLERFDYYLNIFKYNKAIGALANNQSSATLYHDVMNALLPATYTSGEIGDIITLARQGSIGSNVDKNYTGVPHLVVLTPRANLLPSEDLSLDIYFVESGVPQKVELFWKPIGGATFNTVTAVRQTNNHHFKVTVPASTLGVDDFEYYILGTTSDDAEEVAPKSAPTRNYTVVKMANFGDGGLSDVFEAEINYTVVSEAGSNGIIAAVSSIACSNSKYLLLPDVGDEFELPFTVPNSGEFNIFIRVMTGNATDSVQFIQNNAYQVNINNQLMSPSILESSFSKDKNGIYFGMLQCTTTLSAGVNKLKIGALMDSLRIDYLQCVSLPDIIEPHKPENLSATQITSSRVSLKYSAASDNVGVVSYEIYIGSTLLAITTDTSYTLLGLTPGKTYNLTVKAIDAANNKSVSSESFPVTTVSSDIDITFTIVEPTIDGVQDEIWPLDLNPIDNFTFGGNVSTADLSGKWSALWDTKNLYFLVNITDQILKTDGPNWYNDDRIEIFIDANGDRATVFGAKDYQYYLRPNSSVVNEQKLNKTLNVKASMKVIPGGYCLEMKIPFATLGITPSNNYKIGLDVQVGDDDGGGDAEGKKAWYSIDDNTWQNPALLGVASFVGYTQTSVDNVVHNEIEIYPNPANSIVKISNLQYSSHIRIYNSQGEMAHNSLINNEFEIIDVKNWEKGLYLITIQNENGIIFNKKIIVE